MMDSESSHQEGGAASEGVSRRRVISGAGLALATGLAAGTGAAIVGAPLAGASDGQAIATGQPGTTALEFVCRIAQEGTDFSGLGYLTQVAGVDPDTLFTDPGQRDVTHALVVATATGTLVARSVDGAVHALDIVGDLDIFLRRSGGASFADRRTFTTSQQLASYALKLQDVLTVIAPQTGLPVLNGTAEQVDVGTIGGRRFGRNGQDLRFAANGTGSRTDTKPDLSNVSAQLTIAGSLIVV